MAKNPQRRAWAGLLVSVSLLCFPKQNYAQTEPVEEDVLVIAIIETDSTEADDGVVEPPELGSVLIVATTTADSSVGADNEDGNTELGNVTVIGTIYERIDDDTVPGEVDLVEVLVVASLPSGVSVVTPATWGHVKSRTVRRSHP
jgi:hypothetical protein